jgi:DNA repair protein RadC
MTKRIEELDDFEKPREKLREKGPEALDDRELIAIQLGSGSTDKPVLQLATRIKKEIQNKGQDLNLDDLLKFEGVGLAKASRILSGIELSRRLFRQEGKVIESPEDVLPLIEFIRDKDQEYFVSVSLNGANEVIDTRVVTKGLVNKTQVHPREVFAPVLQDRATSVIFAHNHPSGSLEIGKKDRELTRKLEEAAELLGIKVLDHLIVTKKEFLKVS